jgi:hypothetical protein
MSDELRAEYPFDYRKAQPNRFAIDMPPGGRIVYLEPEVAAAFTDSAQVNRLLKALLATMPPTSPTQGASSLPEN